MLLWVLLTHHMWTPIPLTAGDQRLANWYLINGIYIHFLMDGMVGCFHVWSLMDEQYKVLDGRFCTDGPCDRRLPNANAETVAAFKASGKPWPAPDSWVVPVLTGTAEYAIYAPMCLLVYLAIKTGKPWRRALELILCTCHIYGTFVFMAGEEMTGGKNLWPGRGFSFDDLTYYWFGYLSANLLWFFYPTYRIIQLLQETSAGLRGESVSVDGKKKGKVS